MHVTAEPFDSVRLSFRINDIRPINNMNRQCSFSGVLFILCEENQRVNDTSAQPFRALCGGAIPPTMHVGISHIGTQALRHFRHWTYRRRRCAICRAAADPRMRFLGILDFIALYIGAVSSPPSSEWVPGLCSAGHMRNEWCAKLLIITRARFLRVQADVMGEKWTSPSPASSGQCNHVSSRSRGGSSWGIVH
jgi:hypothetical protein